MSSQAVAKAAQGASRLQGLVRPVNSKYTTQSTGIWERIRRFFAVDPTRSNGVPLNPQFRNPPPGSNPEHSYRDIVTIPAGDIAENPYWKRDGRRSYPQLSTVTQGDVVGLLTVGSAAAPKQELIGDVGSKAIVSAKESGEKGLAVFLKENKGVAAKDFLNQDGSPVYPVSMATPKNAGKMTMTEVNAYPEEYPCRTFA